MVDDDSVFVLDVTRHEDETGDANVRHRWYSIRLEADRASS